MNDTWTGQESSDQQPPANDSDSTSTESLSLHDLLAAHLQACSECQTAMEAKRPMGLGTKLPYCSEYKGIIQAWADREGAVNNIVAHDEFGNPASKNVHERYPAQWG